MCASKAPGSDGLEVVQYDRTAPEVISYDGLNTPVVEQMRRQSHDLPEVVTQSLKTADAPSPSSLASADIGSIEEQHMKQEAPSQILQHDPRRRHRRLIWVLVAIILLLVTAGAVVGGVIGRQQADRNSISSATSSNGGVSTSTPSSTAPVVSTTTSPTSVPTSRPSAGPMKATQNSGLALITAKSGAERYAYQQNSNGTIAEIPYKGSAWSLKQTDIVTSNANAGSPLTAISVALDGKTYRILAFVNTNEQVVVTNTTGDGIWSRPIVVSGDDQFLTSSPALAVCAEQKTQQVMRLYYASQDNHIQELGFDFSTQAWTKSYTVQDANPKSGVACTIQNGINHLYYRNRQTIAQWRKTLADPDATWQRSKSSSKEYLPEDNTDIEVTTDGAGTDYIFYRTSTPPNGFVRASFAGTDQGFSGYINMTNISAGSKFAAAPIGDGASGDILLLSQPLDSTAVSWATSSADGSRRATGVLG